MHKLSAKIFLKRVYVSGQAYMKTILSITNHANQNNDLASPPRMAIIKKMKSNQKKKITKM